MQNQAGCLHGCDCYTYSNIIRCFKTSKIEVNNLVNTVFACELLQRINICLILTRFMVEFMHYKPSNLPFHCINICQAENRQPSISGFNLSLVTLQMLMHEKPCVPPIFVRSGSKTYYKKSGNAFIENHSLAVVSKEILTKYNSFKMYVTAETESKALTKDLKSCIGKQQGTRRYSQLSISQSRSLSQTTDISK